MNSIYLAGNCHAYPCETLLNFKDPYIERGFRRFAPLSLILIEVVFLTLVVQVGARPTAGHAAHAAL
jgi:hypothetical protein